MSKLTDFKLLSFDVYGTLIDWETGILSAFQPYLEKCGAGNRFTKERLLAVFHELEHVQQVKTPEMPYSQVLTTIHPQWAEKLGLAEPSPSESAEFGQSVGKWPAFPDTVDALKRLGKTYKLVVLSNVDRQSFAASNAGPLEGVHFDGILTAQDIGSYKPDPRNFDYMLDCAQKTFGIEKAQVLQTAQSQKHDHHPASKKGIKSAWIARAGAAMGNVDEEIYNWKFNTLGEMADAVEKEKAA